MTEQHPLSTAAVQRALNDPIDVPHQCTCAYVRLLPYRLIERQPDPECTVHDPEEPGEVEKDREQ